MHPVLRAGLADPKTGAPLNGCAQFGWAVHAEESTELGSYTIWFPQETRTVDVDWLPATG